MDENIIKGIAGALGKAGAAVTDQSQGTSFYRDILDREKEDRARTDLDEARELARQKEERTRAENRGREDRSREDLVEGRVLDREKEERANDFKRQALATAKIKLDNDNAKSGVNTLLGAFTLDIKTAGADSSNITPDLIASFEQRGQSLLSAVANNPSLTKEDKVQAQGLVNSTFPQVQSLADISALNVVGRTESGLGGWSGLTPGQKAKARTQTTTAAALTKGDTAFSEFTGTTPLEATLLSEEQADLQERVEKLGVGSFTQLLDQDEPLALELLGQDVGDLKTNKSQAMFLNTKVEDDRTRLSAATTFQGEMGTFLGGLQETLLGEDTHGIFATTEGTLDAVFSPDNLYTDNKGITNYRKSPDDVVMAALAPFGTKIQNGQVALPELLKLKRQSELLETKLPGSGIPDLIAQAISDEMGTVTERTLEDIAYNFKTETIDTINKLITEGVPSLSKVDFSVPISPTVEIREWVTLLNGMSSAEQGEELESMRELGNLPPAVLKWATDKYNLQQEENSKAGPQAVRRAVEKQMLNFWHEKDKKELLEEKQKALDVTWANVSTLQGEEKNKYAVASNAIAAEQENLSNSLHGIWMGYIRNVTNKGGDALKYMSELVGKDQDLHSMHSPDLVAGGKGETTLEQYKQYFMANIYDLDMLKSGIGLQNREPTLMDLEANWESLMDVFEESYDGTLPNGTSRLSEHQGLFGVEVWKDRNHTTRLNLAQLAAGIL